ncbi:MAG: hypothetical protein KY454_04310 [Actinobacteria bacterium]|nr:hypothetical protein [Actinomycetota bacterium]MBW3650119.1 hypothetical protein [Actinomycetota bacterium]
MPASLRSRVALLVLLGTFLIPVVTSSLRGLTHVLTCAEETEIPFTLITPASGDPVIVSSRTITRDEPEGVCGGLVLDMGVGPAGQGRVALRLPITNNTEFDWQGSVKLKLGAVVVPVDIGEIKAGETGVDTVRVTVPPGQVELNGSLLIGP